MSRSPVWLGSEPPPPNHHHIRPTPPIIQASLGGSASPDCYLSTQRCCGGLPRNTVTCQCVPYSASLPTRQEKLRASPASIAQAPRRSNDPIPKPTRQLQVPSYRHENSTYLPLGKVKPYMRPLPLQISLQRLPAQTLIARKMLLERPLFFLATTRRR